MSKHEHGCRFRGQGLAYATMFKNITDSAATTFKHHLKLVKPGFYSVVRAGIHGLARCLIAYCEKSGVRVNALSPVGVFNGQPEELAGRFSANVPLGRIPNQANYQGSLLYLCSDASAYMTGSNLNVDGGRNCR